MNNKEQLYKSIAHGRTTTEIKTDSTFSQNTGKGIAGRDKLTEIRPSSMSWSEIDLLNWYVSVPFLARLIDRQA